LNPPGVGQASRARPGKSRYAADHRLPLEGGKADGMATQDRKRHGNIPQRHLRPPHLFFSIHTPPARNFHCGTPISFLDLR
jgi:hypothetical protein